MIEQQAVDAVKLGVMANTGIDAAPADKMAKSFLQAAVVELGRMQGVDFNKRFEPFTLTANKATYIIGQEILSKYPKTWNIEELERTDTQDWPITVLGFDDYNDLTRGHTSTGAPTWATVHSDTATLEVSPIPDSDYAVRAYITKEIKNFTEIPSRYHDVVIQIANSNVRASLDPNSAIAISKAREGKSEVQTDSLTASSPSRFMVDRGIDPGKSGKTKADSSNLRPG